MDETKKRDQNSVIIFYTLVLRRFFLTSFLAQLLYGNSEGMEPLLVPLEL